MAHLDRVRLVSLFLLFLLALPSAAQEHPQASAASFRWEAASVDNTADLYTLFLRQPNADPNSDTTAAEIPILSVLKDTLGSNDSNVHRLRYVWVHTYTVPSLRQRLAAGVPFLYHRFGNAPALRESAPSIVVDIAAPSEPIWKRIRGLTLKILPFYPKPPLFQTTINTYTSNQSRYKNSQLSRATVALDVAGLEPPPFTEPQTRELQARLSQAQKFVSQFLGLADLERMFLNEMNAMRLACSQNWELLRRRAEEENLYFDPLLLPDGTATHAVLWVAKDDLAENSKRNFDGRFLSIRSPWSDRSLSAWKGLTEMRYFDNEGRQVSPETLGARAVELIPLALYGLDHPKIPALLIDFREPLNAKQRELSAKVRDVVMDNLIPVSTLSKIGNATARIFTRRRGADILQPSRWRSYSLLKAMLAFNGHLSPPIRAEIARNIELLADNPLENDTRVELQIARNQYQALLAYTAKPDGLRARLQRDRRAELASGVHAGAAKVALRIVRAASIGLYTHREPERPDLQSLLEGKRRDASYKRLLQAVVVPGSNVEIEWDLDKVRNALSYLAASHTMPLKSAVDLALNVFMRSADAGIKRLCLDAMFKVDGLLAQKIVLDLIRDQKLDDVGLTIAAHYLNLPSRTMPLASISPLGSAEAPPTN